MDWFIETIWEFIVNNFWDSLLFWRILSIVLLFLLGLAFLFRKHILRLLNSDKKQNHDKDIFLKSANLMNEEQFLNMIDTLGTNRLISYQSNKANEFLIFFKSEGNQFIDKKLKKRSDIFRHQLNDLLDFTTVHFFWYPDNQSETSKELITFALYPEALHGYGTQEELIYAKKCEQELYKKLDDLKKCYNQYRKQVKSNLMI